MSLVTKKTKKASVEKTTKKKSAEKKAAVATIKSKKPVTIILKGAPNQKIYLAGSFNNWDKESHPMDEMEGTYSIQLHLDEGIYEYKFLVDNVWTLDPDPGKDWTQNAFGSLNSLLRVE